MNPTDLPNIRNITVSGRIGSGATTLATKLSETLGWNILDGGKLFRAFTKDHGYAKDRDDQFDLDYEEKIKKILREEQHHIIQSHLAGFDAQGIEGIFKILLICVDNEGNDKIEVRIDRLVNRDSMSIDQAKQEAREREEQNLAKWRRLYANNDENWVNWDTKYYDLVINTYSHNPEETLRLALEGIGFKK
ncbi:MAG TPA: cytidylate kinase family protein [Candidatus Saccharimonadales bacterium]|nr:cytidylate kinase family protein [Candidatus Saccharimonadales bacterium]